MTAILASLAFLKALKPWHIMLAAFFAWTGIVGVKAYRKGGEAVIETAKEQGKVNAEKSAKIHEKARTPGAADRLRRDACRDC